MPEDKISPEEKLLTLIRGKKKKSEEKSDTELPKEKKIKKPRIVVFPRINSKHLLGLTRFGAKPLLIVIIILLVCFVGYESRSGIKIKDRVNLLLQKEGKEKKETEEEPVALKPYSYYTQEIKGKSLFAPLVIEKPVIAVVKKIEKIEDICKNYLLKGVIIRERPEAFIEDSKSRRNFTVNIGDTIGKVQVKDIKKNGVTLGYEDQIYDLFF